MNFVECLMILLFVVFDINQSTGCLLFLKTRKIRKETWGEFPAD